MAILSNVLSPTSAFLGGDKHYVFREYPKMVYPDGWDAAHPTRGGVQVGSPEEEAEVMGEKFVRKEQSAPYIPPAPAMVPIVAPDTGERKFLTTILAKLGEKFDLHAPIVEMRARLEALASAPEPESAPNPAPVAPVEVEPEKVAPTPQPEAEIAPEASVEGLTEAAE